jgi:hypothetical protein
MKRKSGVICISLFCLYFFPFSVYAADRNIYVDASALDGGDGSIQAPLNELVDLNWSTITNWVETGYSVFINLKRGEVWRETLTIGASGAPGNPITVRPYGSGSAPVIKTTALKTSKHWTKIYDSQGKRVYKLTLPVDRTSVPIRNDARLPAYSYFNSWNDDSTVISNMTDDGYFFSKNGSTACYLRKDDGDIGNIELAIRKQAISIGSRDNITVDGLVLYGGSGGENASYHWYEHSAIHSTDSTNLKVKNCDIKFARTGSFHLSFKNLLYENVNITDSRSHGAYFGGNHSGSHGTQTADGLTISKCRVVGVGEQPPDFGDVEALGIHTVQNILIEDSYFSSNGRSFPENRQSALVSVVASYNVTVLRNHFYDAGGAMYHPTGSQGLGTENTITAYNIFDTWGQHDSLHDFGDCALYFAGGGTKAPSYGYHRVYNNLFRNGPMSSTWNRGALFIHADVDAKEFIIKENIFDEVGDCYDMVIANANSEMDKIEVINNTIYRTSGTSIWMKYTGRQYDYDEHNQWLNWYNEYSNVTCRGISNEKPELIIKNEPGPYILNTAYGSYEIGPFANTDGPSSRLMAPQNLTLTIGTQQ